MQFPAVTICNINSFRTTEAAKLQIYDILSDTFIPVGKQKEENIVLSIQQLKATNIDLTLEDVYTKTGHRRDDFIVSCFFKGERCRGDDWKVTMTDYGMCYTFNGGPFDKKKVRSTSQIGPKGGLRLHLNIEQYEYMNGPNQGAGARLLVHDQMEIPAVTSLGTAIPPGSHALVGMSLHKIENLPQPFGACSGGAYLDYYDYYSVQGCLQECKQKYIVGKCQCKEPHMKTERSDATCGPLCKVGTDASYVATDCATLDLTRCYTLELDSVTTYGCDKDDGSICGALKDAATASSKSCQTTNVSNTAASDIASTKLMVIPTLVLILKRFF